MLFKNISMFWNLHSLISRRHLYSPSQLNFHLSPISNPVSCHVSAYSFFSIQVGSICTLILPLQPTFLASISPSCRKIWLDSGIRQMQPRFSHIQIKISYDRQTFVLICTQPFAIVCCKGCLNSESLYLIRLSVLCVVTWLLFHVMQIYDIIKVFKFSD